MKLEVALLFCEMVWGSEAIPACFRCFDDVGQPHAEEVIAAQKKRELIDIGDENGACEATTECDM